MMPTRIKIDAPSPAPESDDVSFYKVWNEAPKDVDFAPGFRFELRYSVTYQSQVYDKRVVYFLAHWRKDGVLRVTEHSGYQWWDWNPPHRIQSQTIDPLLASVATYLSSPQAGRWLARMHPKLEG